MVTSRMQRYQVLFQLQRPSVQHPTKLYEGQYLEQMGTTMMVRTETLRLTAACTGWKHYGWKRLPLETIFYDRYLHMCPSFKKTSQT
mmetsp:Transcript_16695/g.46419  ORF Transcript_16695/g.46419 Transcript_16695/m.46419 type:complete len:87 (-) Transcript_16695:212-472(-)